MAPLPDNNTARLFIKYTSINQHHEAVARLPPGGDATLAQSMYSTLGPLIAALLPTGDSVLGARYQAAGSLVSLPLSNTTYAGTAGAATDPDRKANFISWTGRSSDGRRVKFTVFTPIITPDEQGFRQTTMTTAQQNLFNALLGTGADLRSVSGQSPIWNSYVNYGTNSYFQRKARRTG